MWLKNFIKFFVCNETKEDFDSELDLIDGISKGHADPLFFFKK